jgi:hypothetical protein
MSRATSLAVVALTLVLVPAPAGAGTTRPPLGLTVTPARVALAGTGKASVRITNPGRGAVVVDVGRAGFSLDLRGRPRVVARAAPRAATAWLTVQPGHFVLPAGASKWLTVSSRLPRRAEPGDHDALVLFTTRPRRSAGVAVRMRIGVVVVVRAPGRVVRSVAIRALRVRRAGRTRTLELVLANRGNVTEAIDAVRIRLSLVRNGVRASVRGETRALRPRTNGVVQFRYRGRLAGWITARVRLTLEPGRPALSRTFRVKL